MDSAHNPYAPSHASLTAGDVRDSAQLWRDGKVLVMPRDRGDLPPRCVKCNQPADEPTKTRTVYWHHPGFYAFFLINVVLYIVVALIARKTAKVSPGLCDEHKRKRSSSIALAWGGLVVGIVAMFAAAAGNSPGLSLLALLITLVAIVVGAFRARIVHPQRIDTIHVRLKGCGEEFLAALPEFRPGTRNQ